MTLLIRCVRAALLLGPRRLPLGAEAQTASLSALPWNRAVLLSRARGQSRWLPSRRSTNCIATGLLPRLRSGVARRAVNQHRTFFPPWQCAVSLPELLRIGPRHGSVRIDAPPRIQAGQDQLLVLPASIARSSGVCHTFRLKSVRAMTALDTPAISFGTPERSITRGCSASPISCAIMLGNGSSDAPAHSVMRNLRRASATRTSIF